VPKNVFVSRKLSVTSLLAIFVLIFTVAAASAVVVFGYAEGPPAGENGWPGGTGVNCTSCHSSFNLNDPSSNSGITTSGFPTSGYVPGQQYTLNITVGLIGPQTSPPRRRYGFQISARSSSTAGNPQAGTFALIGNTGFDTPIGSSTTTSPTPVNGILYVSHNAAGVCALATSCTWQVSWTAPPDTSLGTIEFDIAGNSANGDFTNQNDYILTKAITVSPTAPSSPPQFASSNPSFPHIGSIRGGTTITLNGSNFVQGAVVFFGSKQVGTSFVSSSQLTAVSPSASGAGTVDLKVQNPDGKAATLAGAFTYFDDSTLKIAYAIATPATSKQADIAATSEAPAGSGIFSFSQNNILVTTVGTASATPTNSFLMFASSKPFKSVNGPIPNNTGVAIINRSGSTANLTFTLINSDGTIKAGPQPGPALADGAHLQGFITDANFFGAAADNFEGTLKVDSTQPVSALTLQLTNNQQPRNEALFTSFPVADLTQAPAVGAKLVFAHLLGGGGFQTLIVLMNTTSSPISGNVFFFKDSPSMPGFDFGTGPLAQVAYSIPPFSEQSVTSIGTGALTDGFAVVVPDSGKATPVGTGVFVFTQGAFTVTTAGVPSSPAIQSGLIFVDTNPTANGLAQFTGVALANSSSTQTADVSFKLRNLVDGQVVASRDLSQVPGHHALGPNTHDALFVDQIFTNGEANHFTGTLSIETASPDGISALTLLQTNNQRGDALLTTLPVATESSSTAPVFFPQLVAFGGFQTQLILLNPSGNAASSGTLNFLSEVGSPLALPLNDQVNSSFGYNLPSKGGSTYK
jgi:IPT/TIG domain-containing protein